MKPPIFIIGCGRSGTTLLRELINQCEDIFVLKESAFIPYLYKQRKDYGDFSTAEYRERFISDLKSFKRTSKDTAIDIFEMNEDQLKEKLEEVAPTNYTGALHKLFEATARNNNAVYWGDKTPLYTSYIPLISELFPNARIIHLIRDPRDVSKSIKSAGWSPTIKGAAKIWKKQVSKGLEGRKLDINYYEMKCESLLINPTKELDKLFDWLGIECEENLVEKYEKRGKGVDQNFKTMRELIGKPIQKSRAYSWKKNMKIADIAEVESVAEAEIKKVGYEITNYEVPLTRKIKSSLIDVALPIASKVKRKLVK